MPRILCDAAEVEQEKYDACIVGQSSQSWKLALFVVVGAVLLSILLMTVLLLWRRRQMGKAKAEQQGQVITVLDEGFDEYPDEIDVEDLDL